MSSTDVNWYEPEVSSLVPVSIVLVESVPEGLVFNSSATHPSIFQAWLSLMAEARSSLDISSFYWTLTNKDTGTQEPSAQQVGGTGDLYTLHETQG